MWRVHPSLLDWHTESAYQTDPFSLCPDPPGHSNLTPLRSRHWCCKCSFGASCSTASTGWEKPTKCPAGTCSIANISMKRWFVSAAGHKITRWRHGQTMAYPCQSFLKGKWLHTRRCPAASGVAFRLAFISAKCHLLLARTTMDRIKNKILRFCPIIYGWC